MWIFQFCPAWQAYHYSWKKGNGFMANALYCFGAYWAVDCYSSAVLKVSIKHKFTSSFLHSSPFRRAWSRDLSSISFWIFFCLWESAQKPDLWLYLLTQVVLCSTFTQRSVASNMRTKPNNGRLCINIPSRHICTIHASKERLNYYFNLHTLNAFLVAGVISLFLGAPYSWRSSNTFIFNGSTAAPLLVCPSLLSETQYLNVIWRWGHLVIS